MSKTLTMLKRWFKGEKIIPNAVKMASILSMSTDGSKKIEKSFDENDKISPEIAKIMNNNVVKEIEDGVVKIPLTEMRISIHPGITVSEKLDIVYTLTKTVKIVEDKDSLQDPLSEKIVNAINDKGPENCIHTNIEGSPMLGVEVDGQMIYVKTINEKNSISEKIFNAMINKGSENCIHTTIGGIPMLGVDVEGQMVYIKLNEAE